MTQYMFGTGQLYAMPVGGGAPLRLGALQDVTIDISSDTKLLYGQYQYALDIARGKSKIEGKISTANIDINAFNQMYFGGTVQSGSEKKQVVNEAGAVPATSTYTVTAANGATFFMDLGVYLATTGLPLKQVAASPAAGEYTVSAVGVYTFNASQASAAVLLNYLYTAATTGSGTLNISNTMMGSVPTFQIVATQLYKGKQFTMCLYSAVSEKLSLPLKQDDHTISEISYSAQANDANQIGFISTTSAVGGGN